MERRAKPFVAAATGNPFRALAMSAGRKSAQAAWKSSSSPERR
jgi:hypothetical protein